MLAGPHQALNHAPPSLTLANSLVDHAKRALADFSRYIEVLLLVK